MTGHRYIELFLNSKEEDGMRYPGLPAIQGQAIPAGVATQGNGRALGAVVLTGSSKGL